MTAARVRRVRDCRGGSSGGRPALTPRSAVVIVLLSFRGFNYQIIPRVPIQAWREAPKPPGRAGISRAKGWILQVMRRPGSHTLARCAESGPRHGSWISDEQLVSPAELVMSDEEALHGPASVRER